ncbi:MAG: hypothetical protein WC895_00825 [Candidatus Shapirobacteria bacterium]|jgi:hypothetical protein
MKKFFSLSLIVASSLFLSACGVKPNTTSIVSSSNSNKDESQEFSLKDLIAKNIPQKCTWQGQEEDTKISGEILISGKKFKQIAIIKNEEGEMKMNSISDGQYIYSWSDQSAAGNFAMKFKIDDTQKDASNTSVSNQQVDMNQKQQFKCSPTIVSDADFTLPQGVEFTDYSELLDQMKSSLPTN